LDHTLGVQYPGHDEAGVLSQSVQAPGVVVRHLVDDRLHNLATLDARPQHAWTRRGFREDAPHFARQLAYLNLVLCVSRGSPHAHPSIKLSSNASLYVELRLPSLTI
jgi:hypothetical protein